MYAKRIIPCLDVKNGRVVKGTSFVNLRDAGDPVECAVEYDKQGADELVLLDITASSDARSIIVDIVSKVAENIFIPFTVGGGIRTVEDFTQILRAGADKVSVNSAAIKNPDLINEAAYKFGSQCVVTAIDAKRNGNSWEVYINGGRIPMGIDAVKWAVTVRRIPDGNGSLKIPHMGWNSLNIRKNDGLFKGIASNPYVYFVHSYFLKADDDNIVSSQTEYGTTIDSSVQYQNIMATQFHPEKSGKVGLQMLQNFAEMCR